MLLAELVLLGLQFLALARGGGVRLLLLDVGDARRELALQRDHILRADAGQRGGCVAVQIHETLEGLLLAAAEEPVDGPVFVGLQVVLVKLAQEISSQLLAEGFLDEPDILTQRGLAKGDAEKFLRAGHDIVLEPLAVQDGNNAIGIRDEIWIGGSRWLSFILYTSDFILTHNPPVIVHRGTRIRQNKARSSEGIPSHHAADGIGEEGGHVLASVGAGEGDLLLGHFGLQLAVEAVGGDEEPVVLRLQLLHPADGGGALRLPIPPARLQRRALQPRPQQRLVAEVPRGLEVVPVGAGEIDAVTCNFKKFISLSWIVEQLLRNWALLNISNLKIDRWAD